MTRQTKDRWTRLKSAAATLGDALSTPRGVAPDRDPQTEVLRRERT